MPLQLRYYGDPVLRKKCDPVAEVTPEIRAFVQQMIETIDANNGIGLAASQVGKLLRIFVIREEKVNSQGDFFLGEPRVFINPVLSSPTEEREAMFEGCLSLPGLHVEVERPLGITVEATDLKGNRFKEEIRGFTARQIMHENDHLNGTLSIDRATPQDRKGFEPALRKIKEKYSSKK